MDADDLQRLSTLLDELLDLPPEERQHRLTALEATDAALSASVRKLLARAARHETADLVVGDHAARRPLAPPDGPAAGDAVGPYRLLRPLGAGGMGSVWLAERADGSLKRQVALKLPHLGWAPGLAERFAREREILASLEHPHIARLYDVGVDERGRPWMALEYVEGEPIDAWCRRRAPDVPARLQMLLQVADAVAFAHARRVLHRDLKPANLLVTQQGQVRLLDFGIAKLMAGDRAAATALTELSGRALTLDYASPEQIRGDALSTASDVYALGVVAYELLTGERPYRLARGSAAELEEAILAAEVPLASARCRRAEDRRALRGDLDAILAQALRKDPTRRYEGVDAMAADIRRHLAGAPVSVRPDTWLAQAARGLRRHGREAVLATAAAAAFAIGLGAGATALVIAVLVVGLGAALWQARRAAAERDRALALAERNEAGNRFLETLLTRAARGGAFTARELLERSERLVESDVRGNPDHRAFVLGQLADLYGVVDQWPSTLPLLERALDAAATGRDRGLHDDLAIRRAIAVGMVGRTDEAARALDALLARRDLSPALRWRALAARGHVAQLVGDYPAVLAHAEAAYQAWQALPRPPTQSEPVLLSDLGWASLKAGRAAESEDHYVRAAAAFEALGLADSGPALHHGAHRALAFQEMGDAREAVRIYDDLVEASRRALPDVPPSLYLVANRAFALSCIGDYEAALHAYAACVEQAGAQGMALVRFNIQMLIVQMEAARGRVEPAQAILQVALDECPSERPEGGPAQFAHQLAEARVELAQGRPTRALEVYGLALQSRLVAAGSADALLGRAEAHLAAGDIGAALTDAEGARDIAQQLRGRRPASFRLGLAHALVARIHAAAGRPGQAQAAIAAALPDLRAQLTPQHPVWQTLEALRT